VGIMNATPGPYGGVRHLYHLRQVLSGLQTLVLPNQVQLAHADQAFDENGALRDERWSKALGTLAKALVETTDKLR